MDHQKTTTDLMSEDDGDEDRVSIPRSKEIHVKVLKEIFGLDEENDRFGQLDIINFSSNQVEIGLAKAWVQIDQRHQTHQIIKEYLNQINSNTLALNENDDDEEEVKLLELKDHFIQCLKTFQTFDLPLHSITSKTLYHYLVDHHPVLLETKLTKLSPLSHFIPLTTHWILHTIKKDDSKSTYLSILHSILSSKSNLNLLLIVRSTLDLNLINSLGLYIMEYGIAFLASISIHLNHSHAHQTLIDAMNFIGPSIILSYLPEASDLDLHPINHTQLWPLYRWKPFMDDQNQEELLIESEGIQSNLNEFFNRRSHLTFLSTQLQSRLDLNSIDDHPTLESQEKFKDQDQIKRSYERLMNELKVDQFPKKIDPRLIQILFGSDTGTAERLAKGLNQKLSRNGFQNTRLKMMNEVNLEKERDEEEVESLFKSDYLIILTSTTGQGEVPLNGRKFWKRLSKLTYPDQRFKKINYMIFGLGDSHYWSKREDEIYFNKASKDLNAKFKSLGAHPVLKIGLGDEQDPNGILTGYQVWEKEVFKVLGVVDLEGDQVGEELDEPITNEHIKLASDFLRGTIQEGLNDLSTGALAESDGQLTKFHGIYQQDDRDVREERLLKGIEPAYSFMVRCRLPAGVCTPQQWLMVDELSRTKGNDSFKLTTRQTFQFHGVVKKNLKGLIQGINQTLMDTLAACGDVNRTVMCSTNPTQAHIHKEVYKLAEQISQHLLPKTTAYGEIWLDKKLVGSAGVFEDEEPMYGSSYLPRKFKIAIAIPPNNDVDVFAHDVGLITIIEDEQIIGYNLCIGGGMGVTHSNQMTYPRLSDQIGFLKAEEVIEVIEKILIVQRDFGNRSDRKQARMKYTIDRLGIQRFIKEIEDRLGRRLDYKTKQFEFERNVDRFGWFKDEIGEEHFTLFIENGRVEDQIETRKEKGKWMKTGLREIAKVHKGTFRLTPNQHLMICNILSEEKVKIQKLLKSYGLDNLDYSGLRLSSSACVAFPTCGLAMAESERYLPILIDKIEKLMEENGLRHDELVMRMTGCPNGCARPWVGEVAFVGKSKGNYLMLLGGNRQGSRLNKPFKESVDEEEILRLMKIMISEYSKFRLNRSEGFGDFSLRVGWIKETTHGTNFYQHMFPKIIEVE